MDKLARTRLAGTIVATALCAVTADAAVAQQRLVLNNQLQLGDVVAGQQLNVVDVSDQVTVSTAASGNSLAGGTEGQPMHLRSTQDMRGDASASTTLTLGGDTRGLTTSVTQARANYLAGTANNAQMTVETDQVGQGDVTASSRITGVDARLVSGGQIASGAYGNTTALTGGATGSGRTAITGTINQTMNGDVRATNTASPRYAPAPTDFSSEAAANAVQVTTGPSSNQDLTVRQRSSGAVVEADTSVWAGNAWNLAGRSRATGNQAVFYNQGGSLIADTDQENSAQIIGAVELSSYDFGAATAAADAVANNVVVGNNDIYVDIDNVQVNTGGVEATASFTGQKGYDAYVGANAAGNSITGYACSECGGNLNANNVQTNAGNVRANAVTTINGSGRNVIAGANAVGNAATFYVTRNGGN
ncbi:holdfast anchor protein HfaD [Brevundimonas faecalis]|uniref:holdfast anchor protein HfaD n=1 Tax=Brevundimonas faecalis TaxID=947378 RepID=UPI00362437F0